MEETQKEFLKDLEPNDLVDILEKQVTEETQGDEQEETKDTEEEARNRRERRLKAKMLAERESAIALAAKLEAITEAQRARESSDEASSYLKQVERIYGTDSPEALQATETLKAAFQSLEKTATERALNVLREEQQREREAIIQEERSLDSMVEEIEDEYDISLDAQTRKGFFQLLEKLSPKDADGNIVHYADHHAIWEELQARKQAPTNSRAKDLASRATVRTGASAPTSVQEDATQRYLRENGLL